MPITAVFPPGDNVVFAHSSYFRRDRPSSLCRHPSFVELPSPAQVRHEAIRLGIPSEGEGVETKTPRGTARLVPFPSLRLLVKYGSGVSAAEGKCMLLLRRLLSGSGPTTGQGLAVPVPEVFGWRADGGESFVYMSLPEGVLLEEAWDGMSEAGKEKVCGQLRDMVAGWRRLKQGCAEFVGRSDAKYRYFFRE
ncbi:hypothetical protein VTK56DRAFT_4020 [Thermocarpiscus australiensis]